MGKVLRYRIEKAYPDEFTTNEWEQMSEAKNSWDGPVGKCSRSELIQELVDYVDGIKRLDPNYDYMSDYSGYENYSTVITLRYFGRFISEMAADDTIYIDYE